MKNIRVKKEYLAFGVMIAVVVLIGIISVTSILSIQGNAKVVNYAGIVRGGTQKLIKEEVMGWHYMQKDNSFAETSEWYPNDALLGRLDTIVNELLTGVGPNGLTVLQDEKYLDDMQRVQEYWEQLKGIIFQVREGASPDELFNSSQEYFALVNDAVFSAEAYTDKRVNSITNTLIVVNALFLILLFVILFYYMRRIANPLSLLTSFMKKATATGELELRPEDIETIARFSDAKDETGQAISACALFVKRVSDTSKVLEKVAEGDLSTELALLSDKDTMGLSLQKMIDRLNVMFRAIHTSTDLVADGARRVSDGSTTLAQGSSEQAASIEHLSNSITEIAKKTKANADTADHAAKLADTIRNNAEKGNRQMTEMIDAVKDINQSSQNISKVIKVIDDIAFQTNILALNAAVEAARASQHGKGFAVVAEEVRNLASKSAEAAQNTSAMIQDSMEKAELGVRIAGETAASLEEIISGINESTLLISEIAKSSEEQTSGIIQINTDVDQVVQVVRQNIATAEESAVTSDEMTSQFKRLEELVLQFRLKDV